jgi:uncharacterized membrane protein (DUF485 family)
MGHFGHSPQNEEHEDPDLIARRSRLGLWLFAIYCGLYAGFMYLCAFEPKLMESAPVAGVNLAIWYGLALIVGALTLALVYAVLCRQLEARS